MSNCVVSLFDNIDGEIRRKHTSQEKLCNYLGIERRTYLNWKNKKINARNIFYYVCKIS